MTELADTFDAAFSKAVDLGNRIADKDKDADLWDIADGLLAGAIQYWLYSRQPCGDPRCQDCMPISTAQGRMAELRSEEHTSELQSRGHLVCRLLLEKKKKTVVE